MNQNNRLASYEHDRSKQNSQGEKERDASDPPRPENEGMIESGSTFRGKLCDLPDARTDDEIMGQGQEKKDRHESELGCQDHGPFRWACDRNTTLMRQQRSRQQEHGDRGPDHNPESTGRGQKERRFL